MPIVFPTPEVIGEVTQELMDAISINTAPNRVGASYATIRNDEALNCLTCFIADIATGGTSIPDTVQIAGSFSTVNPERTQRISDWHTDGDVLLVSDALTTEYLVGSVSRRRLARLLGVGAAGLTYSSNLWELNMSSDDDLRSTGLEIWRPKPRQIVYHHPEREPVHRSARNRSKKPIPRRFLAILDLMPEI